MIRKWRIYPVDQPVTLPPEAEVIHVGEQGGLPHVWTTDIPTTPGQRSIVVQVFGTGMTPPESAEHLGSVQMRDGFVWHLFSVRPTSGKGSS